jgi:hypothetical protein
VLLEPPLGGLVVVVVLGLGLLDLLLGVLLGFALEVVARGLVRLVVRDAAEARVVPRAGARSRLAEVARSWCGVRGVGTALGEVSAPVAVPGTPVVAAVVRLGAETRSACAPAAAEGTEAETGPERSASAVAPAVAVATPAAARATITFRSTSTDRE